MTSANLCDYVLVAYENLKMVWREGVVIVQNRVERVFIKKILQTFEK